MFWKYSKNDIWIKCDHNRDSSSRQANRKNKMLCVMRQNKFKNNVKVDNLSQKKKKQY